MLAPHSTLLSGIFFNSTEQFPDVVNSREVRKAVLSPSPELQPRGGFPSQENSKTQTQQSELYADSEQGKDFPPTIPNQLRVNQCGCLAGQELAAACRSVRQSLPSQVNKSNRALDAKRRCRRAVINARSVGCSSKNSVVRVTGHNRGTPNTGRTREVHEREDFSQAVAEIQLSPDCPKS